jgi:hypothetical protein
MNKFIICALDQVSLRLWILFSYSFFPTWHCEASEERTNNCRDKLPWTIHHTSQRWPHLTSISSRNWRNIWDYVTCCQTLKSRWRWRSGSVNKTHSSIVADSCNHVDVAESMWTAEVIILTGNCITSQNTVHKNYMFCFSEVHIPVKEERIKRTQHTVIYIFTNRSIWSENVSLLFLAGPKEWLLETK